MTRDEYEARKRRLEDERQAGIELIEAGHQAQLRALELVWMLSSGEQATLPPPPRSLKKPVPAPAPAPARPKLKQVSDDVLAVFWDLPGELDRHDVCRAIGYDPPRNALFRVLNGLVEDGYLHVAEPGVGRVPTRYSRVAQPPAKPDA
jgi:hypothetical protein